MGIGAAFNPFLLNPGWLDAAYMSYAWPDYFRTQRQGTMPAQPTVHSVVKGKFHIELLSLIEAN